MSYNLQYRRSKIKTKNFIPTIQYYLDEIQDVIEEPAHPPIEEYKEALKLNPGLLETHYNLSIVYYRQGEKETALSQLKEALRLFPGNEHIIEALERMKEEGE